MRIQYTQADFKGKEEFTLNQESAFPKFTTFADYLVDMIE